MSGKSTKFEITSDPILKSDPRGWFWYSSKDRIHLLSSDTPSTLLSLPVSQLLGSFHLEGSHTTIEEQFSFSLNTLKDFITWNVCTQQMTLNTIGYLFDQCNCWFKYWWADGIQQYWQNFFFGRIQLVTCPSEREYRLKKKNRNTVHKTASICSPGNLTRDSWMFNFRETPLRCGNYWGWGQPPCSNLRAPVIWASKRKCNKLPNARENRDTHSFLKGERKVIFEQQIHGCHKF